MAYKVRGRTGWRGQVRLRNGKYLRKQFADRRDAILWEEDMKDQIRVSPYESRLGLKQLVAEYQTYCDGRMSELVCYQKNAIMQRFLTYFGDANLEDITTQKLQRYLTQQLEERSPGAVNVDLKNLKAMWKWGREQLNILPNPIAKIQKFRYQKRIKYTPPLQDVWAVLMGATPDHKALLITYMASGARRSELFQLTWEDINFERSKIRLTTRKTADGSEKQVWQPINQAALGYLKSLYQRRNPEIPWVWHFNGKPYKKLGNLLPKLCEKAGVKEFGYHGLRRLYASMLMDKGKVSLKTLQRLMRHEHMSTTELYVQDFYDDLTPFVEDLEITPGKEELGISQQSLMAVT